MGSEHESSSGLVETSHPVTPLQGMVHCGVGGVSVRLSPLLGVGSAQVVPTGWSLGAFLLSDQWKTMVFVCEPGSHGSWAVSDLDL